MDLLEAQKIMEDWKQKFDRWHERPDRFIGKEVIGALIEAATIIERERCAGIVKGLKWTSTIVSREELSPLSEDKKAEIDEASRGMLDNWEKSFECGGCTSHYEGQWYVPQYLVKELLLFKAVRTREEDIETIKKLKDKDWFHHPDNALECAINTLTKNNYAKKN